MLQLILQCRWLIFAHFSESCWLFSVCFAAVSAFERLKTRRSAHMFNMMILKREHLDAYCTWLFDILFELERRVDASAYDAFHARFFGRVSELLLDVWLEQNPLNVVEVPLVLSTL